MKIKFIGIIALLLACLHASGQGIRFSRAKEIKLLHNVDSLIQDFELYSSLSDGTKISSSQEEGFTGLFKDSSAVIFDDINPNFLNNNQLVINEKNKSLFQYINDIRGNYQNMYTRVLVTDAGEIIKKLSLINGVLYGTIKIQKEVFALTKDSLPATYKTVTWQSINIFFRDTTDFKPLITGILKSGDSYWNYIPPATPTIRWEKIISINPGISRAQFKGLNSELFLTKPNIKPGFSFGAEGDMRYLLKSMVSYSTGIQFGLNVSYLTWQYSADEYVRADLLTDSDGDKYYRIRDLKNLNEKETILEVRIPVKINYEKYKPSGKGFYVQAGFDLSYLTGRYKYKTDYKIYGYYPQFDYVDYLNTKNNFEEKSGFTGSGTLNLNPINVNGALEAGLIFPVKNDYQMYVGLNYSPAFLNLAQKSTGQQSISGTNVFTSLTSEMGNVSQSFFGIRIGFKRIKIHPVKDKTVNYLKVNN